MQNQFNYLNNPMLARLAEIKHKRGNKDRMMQQAMQPRQGKGGGLAQLLQVLGVGLSNQMGKKSMREEEQAIYDYSEGNRQADQDIIAGAGNREDLVRALMGSPNPQNQNMGRSMMMQPPAKPEMTYSEPYQMEIPDGKGGMAKLTVQRDTTGKLHPVSGKGGGVTTNVKVNNEMNKVAAKSYKDSLDTSKKIVEGRGLMKEAEQLLKRGNFKPGFFGPIRGQLNKILEETWWSDEDTELAASDFDLFNSISKQLGALELDKFGGNDSNRELIVAMQTVLNTNYTKEANLRIIRRKMHAFNILTTRPDFEAAWVADPNMETLSSPNKDGVYLSESWNQYSLNKFNESMESDPYFSRDNGGTGELPAAGTGSAVPMRATPIAGGASPYKEYPDAYQTANGEWRVMQDGVEYRIEE